MFFIVLCFLVLLEKGSDAGPLAQSVAFQKTTKFPRFMESLYNSVLSGKRHLSVIIHSNEAIDVRKSNNSFEAVFHDLGFTQREILKYAKLRLNILRNPNCSPQFTLRVINGGTLQVLDEYTFVAKHNGVTSVPLTRSLKKFILAPPGLNNTLRIKVNFHSSTMDQTSCVKTVNIVSQDTYLVTHTNEKPQRRSRRDPDSSPSYRRAPEVSPKMTYHSVAKRRATSSKTCTKRIIYVNLTHNKNSRIALPQGFFTVVCGVWQPIPIGSEPVVKEVATAIHKAIRYLPKFNNPSCCVPTAFGKLHILYLNSKRHSVLRYLGRINVTRCGCT